MIAEIDSPCGRLWISGDKDNIFEVSWDIIRGFPHRGELDWILSALDAYFSGKGTQFPGQLTFFEKQPVWTRRAAFSSPRRVSDNALLAVSGIPFGNVRTYGSIASGIGNPNLARAVGQACSSNPIPVIVPCHRVVARNSLGGFSSGLFRKEILLTHEGVSLPGIRGE